MRVKSGLLLCVVAMASSVGLAACDDGGSTSVQTVDSSSDVADHDANDQDASVDTEDTVLPAGCTPLDPLPEDGDRNAFGTPCRDSRDCERGLSCSGAECASVVGCAGRPAVSGDDACLVGENPGGVVTAVECTCDAQCVGTEYGEFCVQGACAPGPLCVDAACPAGYMCNDTSVCVATTP